MLVCIYNIIYICVYNSYLMYDRYSFCYLQIGDTIVEMEGQDVL